MNAINAINRELGRIRGTQNNYIRAHHGASAVNYASERSVFDKPLDFKEWFEYLIKKTEEEGYVLSLTEIRGVRVLRREKGNAVQYQKLADFYHGWEVYKENYYL